MSYYLLPKKQMKIELYPYISPHAITQPCISFSIYNYINDMLSKINDLETDTKKFLSTSETTSNLNQLFHYIHPYDFIFTRVPNSKFSVSKLKPFSNIFNIMMEIMYTFNILDSFINLNINTLSVGLNAPSVIEVLNILREDKKDNHYNSIIDILYIKQHIYDDCSYRETTYDFLYYELNDTDYIGDNYCLGILYFVLNILSSQSIGGMCIIKLDYIFYKPIVDILFMFSTIYDSVYIFKPCTSSVLTGERFLVCKNFLYDSQKSSLYYSYFLSINKLIRSIGDNYIHGLVNNQIPYYLTTRIEEANIIIGQQQLESLDLLVNLYRNKNREEKMETLKKNNIQKCIQWCEKYKIPYNKFTDKINIFLTTDKSHDEHGTENIFLPSKIFKSAESIDEHESTTPDNNMCDQCY